MAKLEDSRWIQLSKPDPPELEEPEPYVGVEPRAVVVRVEVVVVVDNTTADVILASPAAVALAKDNV
jgi:hypothetical protein